jgi:tripartite-type tricarboxylate transporter receptor subunit TctC
MKAAAAAYYEGKLMRIVVAFPPGGGYDRMARMVARYLPKYLPGKPNVIVENMPGASGMVGANYVYNIAKPDGLTLGAINRVIPAAELLKIDGVKFELLKYSWVGAAAVESSAFVVRNDLPYKTVEDLKKVKEFNVGATGPGDSTYNFAILIKQYLGINLKITSGYPGTGDIALAVERKELDGYTGAYSSQRPYIARKLLRPILRSGIPSPGIEKLPSAEDLTTDPMAKTIFKMYSVSDRVGRPYVAPPGTSADIINSLRDAFAKVTKDQELKQEAEKLMMDIDYTPSEECLKEIRFFLSQPQEIVNEYKKYIKF